jgi:N-acetylglucosaminyldiphosphoundecaprenol N-acetyl-beta-D-mannosaminyltransferase
MTRRDDTATRRRGDAAMARESLSSSAPDSSGNTVTASPPHPIPASHIAGVRVDNLSEDETVAAINDLLDDGAPHYICVVNAAKVVAARGDEKLRRALDKADIVTADGMSVVWASRMLAQPLKQRVTGIDLFARLVAHAASRELSVYFFGARDEAVRGVVKRFTTEHPGLRVAGFRNGYFDATESIAIADAIKQSGADLLFVAMGSPAQEYWISENLARTGVRFALGVGGSFDHLSGLQRRAPQWMQRAGFEWFYRLLREPRRLWRRYLIGNTAFIALIIRQAFQRKPKN